MIPTSSILNSGAAGGGGGGGGGSRLLPPGLAGSKYPPMPSTSTSSSSQPQQQAQQAAPPPPTPSQSPAPSHHQSTNQQPQLQNQNDRAGSEATTATSGLSNSQNNQPSSQRMPPGFGGTSGGGGGSSLSSSGNPNPNPPSSQQPQQQQQAAGGGGGGGNEYSTPASASARQSPAPSHPAASSSSSSATAAASVPAPSVSFSGQHHSPAVFAPTYATSASAASSYQQVQQQQNQQQQYFTPGRQQQQQQTQNTPFNINQYNPNQYQQQQHHHHHHHNAPPGAIHVPSDVLFASERPGMRPLPDSAYMISASDLLSTQQQQEKEKSQGRHRSHSQVPQEQIAQQAASMALSPFAQRLAKKMHQEIQVERLSDTVDGHHGLMQDYEYAQDSLLNQFGDPQNSLSYQQQQTFATPGTIRLGSASQQQQGATPGRSKRRSTTPRGRSLSSGRVRTLSTSRSASTISTKMRLGSFTVEYKDPTGDLAARLRLANDARRDEVNRRTVTRLHRPTAAGQFADVNPVEPRVLEPGHPENNFNNKNKHAPLVHTLAHINKERVPLSQMTRQQWEDTKRQNAFTQELRRHSCDVARRSISNNALSYVNKHRGVDHTYLSEGAKWYTTPSPRLGIPCKTTIASNQHETAPGPGSYNLPSSFLGR